MTILHPSTPAMADTTPQTPSVAAQTVIKAIAGAEPTPREIAAAAIVSAARQLLPARTDADHLQLMAFQALANELCGWALPDASREVLAEQSPAMRPAPLPAPAKPAAAPQSITLEALAEVIRAALAVPQYPEAIAEHLLAHPCTGPLLRGQAITPTRGSERPWERPGWCDAEGFCWAHDPLQYDSGWSLVRRSRWVLLHPATEQPFANDCWLLPAGAIQVPAEDDQP